VTTFDSGTVIVMVNGTATSVPYGSASTTSSVSSAIASALSSGALVNASASGSTVTITSKAGGSSTNYSLSVSSASNNSSLFNPPSFSISASGSSLTGGTPPTLALSAPAITLYLYDPLGNLTCVVQKGNDTTAFSSCASAPATWRPRSFFYDSLSHLTSAINPESGTISYAYDAAGNLITKTDARGIITRYSYDVLGRLTGKSYSNGDQAVTYAYDQTACLGAASCSNIGRRTGMTDAAGSEAWSYDSMGRPLADQRTTTGVTKSTGYTYNLDGSVGTLTNPSGRAITYTLNSAGRIVSAVDSTGPISYATNALYSPAGVLSSMQNGATLISTFYDNSRLQPCRISVNTTGIAPTSCSDTGNIGNVLDYSYNFNLGTADNGNVIGITNNRDATRSQSFTYDVMNRLTSAQTRSSGVTIPNANCWGLTFGYDMWGNLFSSASSGPSGCGDPLPMNVSMTTSNQVSGYCYDSSGNLLDQGACPSSGAHTYTYNAESQLVSTAGLSYLYDGDGRRVSKSNGKLYWYGMGDEVLDESDGSGNITYEYVFFDGRRIARRDSSNNVDYYFADHLGTARVVANSSGSILDDSDFYPYGGERPVTSSSGSGNSYKFTGKERDTESGLDDFGARYYSSTLGRFVSADWSAVPVPVPYANFTNPQTLNLYAIVRDNPETFADLDGHIIGDSGQALVGGGAVPGSNSFLEQQENQMEAEFFANAEAKNAAAAAQAPQTPAQAQAKNNNVDNQQVGNTTVGSLERTMSNEDRSLSTPKGGDPGELEKGLEALANAIINNAELDHPAKVAPATGTATSQDAQIMRDAYTNRANGGADPVQGRTQYGTSHHANLHSRSASNGLKGKAGRETVYEKFGPFKDSTSRQPTYIYIYNDPGH
jgi:RHS repeat-associated protein